MSRSYYRTLTRFIMKHDPRSKALEPGGFIHQGSAFPQNLNPISDKARMQLAHLRSAELLVKHCRSPARGILTTH